MSKVSVVVPCYNVENYIRQCLDSLVNQTLKDIDIICVNDGSTDNTLSILREYEQKDPRVSVINKNNSGYGNSMNIGFDAASGEYIGIIESDDYADLDMFEKLYNEAKLHSLDVYKSGYYLYYSKPEEKNERIEIVSSVSASRTFCPSTDFAAKVEMVEFFNIKPTIWSAIYRNEFIKSNNIRFNETPGASYQDASFNFKVWVCADRVRLSEDCFVHYRQDNEHSSINSVGKVYCICDEYDEMERFLNENQPKKSVLEPILVRIKYDSYVWNYERISKEFRSDFMKKFRDDFRRHQIEGTLEKEYFERYKWNNLQKILDNDNYVIFSHEEKEKRRKEILSNASKISRPFYRLSFCYEDNGLKYTIIHTIERIKRKLAA